MAYSGGVISAPVSIADVKSALGLSSNDLGTLCSASVINKWVMYKPVRYASVATASQYDKTNNTWKSTADWWLGDAANQRWGMNFKCYESTGTITSTTTSGKTYRNPTAGFFYDLMRDSLRWTYNRPNGGSSAPYRLIDFVGYRNGVPNPLPFTSTRTLFVSGSTGTSATYNNDCAIRQPSSVVVGGLNLQNMTPPSAYSSYMLNLADCYLGVLFYNTSMDDCFWKTSTTKLSALYDIDATEQAKALRIALTDADFTNQYNKNHKDWKTRAFLCSKQLSWCETFASGSCLIACDEAATTCTLAVAGQILIVSFTANKVNDTITVVVNVENNSGEAKTLTSPIIDIYTDPAMPEDTYTFSNTTINNGDTYAFNHQFTGLFSSGVRARFRASYSGGSFDQNVAVVVK